MKKRLFGALTALAMAASLICPAWADDLTVTLTAEQANSEIPVPLSIPPQTPAAVGSTPNRIVILSPTAHAAVEIPVNGGASSAEVVLLSQDGTYTALDDQVTADGSAYVMLPSTSNTLLVLQRPAFTDTTRTAWYYGGVLYAYHNGLMSGTASTAFSPSAATSRAMLVTILWRSAGESAAKTSAGFSDVSASAYYAGAVDWAKEAGVVTGDGGKFSPAGVLTRQQLAAMLYRYAQSAGMDTSGRADLSKFSDASAVASWADDAMSWAVSRGLITGITAGGKTTLAPGSGATRAQTATILMRFLAAEE